MRYWDGTRWTEHTAPAPGAQAPAPAYPGAEPAYGAPAYQGEFGAAGAYSTAKSSTTPDGVPLASWGRRAGALLIDWVIVSLITGVATLPWLREIVDVYIDLIDQAIEDAEAGTETSIDMTALQSDLAVPFAAVALITVAVTLCYHVGFLMWKQATPGKLAVGLRVRLRERPGRMPFGTVLLRWVGQFGVRVLALVPLVGCMVTLYMVLDYLWPLWDDKRQAVHDKVAKTNVVRIR